MRKAVDLTGILRFSLSAAEYRYNTLNGHREIAEDRRVYAISVEFPDVPVRIQNASTYEDRRVKRDQNGNRRN